VLTFVDVAGNEKYAKTMIRGICSHYPDYALILIDAESGLTKTCIDHFKLAFAFTVPVIIVITKVDLVSENQLFDVTEDLKYLIKSIDSKIPLSIQNEDDVALCSRMIQEDICPVF
jgi:GTPase